jgi:hypothetical protein
LDRDSADDSRRLKRHRLTSVYDDDMDWLRREINEIKNEIKHVKECMMEVGEYLKEEVGFNVSEVVSQLQQLT